MEQSSGSHLHYPYIPLVSNPRNNDAYYLPVKSIQVLYGSQEDVVASLPVDALDLDVNTGRDGVLMLY